MKIVGIDNGLDGGLVLIDSSTRRVEGRMVMPVLDITKNGKARRDYDLPTIRMCFESWQPELVLLEEAQAMPASVQGRTQGTVSSFGTGMGFGIMRGMLAGMKLRVQHVHPRSWQAALFKGLSRDNTKQCSAVIAARLFPGVDWRASERCKKPHSGLTDAVCIAEYGCRLTGGMAGKPLRFERI